MKNKYFFDHIPKCGGTSVNAIFKRLYDEKDITSSISIKAKELFARGNVKPFITGHVTYMPGDSLEADRYAFTVLRDPIDRVVSMFYFWKNNPEGQRYHKTSAINDMTFRDFVFTEDSGLLRHICNYQTEHFLSLLADNPIDLPDEKKLAYAKAALELFDLVGVQDLLDDFIFLLAWENGFPSFSATQKHNKTLNRPEVREITSEIYERIKQLNRLDNELVAFARERFLAHKNKVFELILANSNMPQKQTDTFQPILTESQDKKKAESIDFGSKEIQFVNVSITGNVNKCPPFLSGETLTLTIEFFSLIDEDDLTLGFNFRTNEGISLYASNTRMLGNILSVKANEQYKVVFTFRNDFGFGYHTVDLSLHRGDRHTNGCFSWSEKVLSFDNYGQVGAQFEGLIRLCPDLTFEKLSYSKTESKPSLTAIQRLGVMNPPLSDFSSIVRLLAELTILKSNEVISILVEVTNAGINTWPSTGLSNVALSYHWLNDSGDVITLNGLRTLLPRDLMPGETTVLTMVIKSPEMLGTYQLQISLVQDGVRWFDDVGCNVMMVLVE